MVRDFTILTFRTLLKRLADAGYSFQSCRNFYNSPAARVVVLRHDVDKRPHSSIVTAEIEHEAGISGTYYFRSRNGMFEEETVQQISKLGHEIGYHYEDLQVVSRKSKVKCQKSGVNREEELAAVAFTGFRENLARLRNIAHVDTICMHGSPLSSSDSRVLWKYFDYRTLGIIAEPYFDFSLEGLLYLTDTGRRWNGSSVSVRDRVYTRDESYYAGWKRKPLPGSAMCITEKSTALQRQYSFRKTGNIMKAIGAGNMPERLMITLHPQRWNDSPLPWLREYFWQNSKNAVKYFMIKKI
jgi:hypothetical protein